MSDTMIPTWTLGDRLRKARKAANLEPADIAFQLGVTERTISNYETDQTTPKLLVLRVWSELTGAPLWWLLDDNPPHGDSTAGYTPGQLVMSFGLAA